MPFSQPWQLMSHLVFTLTGVGNWSMEGNVKKLRLWG